MLYLREDNPAFDVSRFSYATGHAEDAYLKDAAECGREVPA